MAYHKFMMSFGKKIVSVLVCFLLLTLYIAPLYADNQTASVSVPPSSDYLQAGISLTNTGNDFAQNTTLNYTLTYGSYISSSYPITVQAAWSQGTIDGDSSPSIDILDYSIGSAANGINNTAPVVDTVNRTITWTYNSFPGNTHDKIVTFSLKTNSSYTENKTVAFTITAKTTASGASATDSSTKNYLYDNSLSPTQTPTPTSAPTTTPTPGTTSVTSTPTPTQSLTPSPAPLTPVFNNVEVRSISNNDANIFVSAVNESKFSIVYGSSLSLNHQVSFNDFSTSKLIVLTDLEANTQYFYKIIATSSNGKQTVSDIFTFTTAYASTPVLVDQNSIVVVSGNNVIFDTSAKPATSSAANLVIIPQNSSFQFKFSLQNKQSAKNLKLILRKITGENVLGSNTASNQTEENTISVVAFELSKGTYSAVLDTNQKPGTYELIASYIDNNGNLIEQSLANIKIANPFTVLDNDKNPIEGSSVFLYVYSETSGSYIPLSPNFVHITNPSFTDSFGVISFALPIGKYKASVSEIGYESKTVNFEILESEKSGYPIVHLKKAPINIITILQFYWHSYNEVFLYNTGLYIASLGTSIRFFDLISALSLLSLVLLSLIAFIRKNNIENFPNYILYLYHHNLNLKAKENYIKGLIKDNSGKVSGVNVYLIDDKNKEVVANTKTNINGEFFFNKLGENFKIIAMKKGYYSIEEIKARKGEIIEIKMDKSDFKEAFFRVYIAKILDGVFGISFEILLFTSLFFELLFISYFGFAKIAPFIAISLFNIAVWLLHLRHTKSQQLMKL